MPIFRLATGLSLLLATSAFAAPANAPSAENGTPYQVLYDVLHPAKDIAKFDRLVAIERIGSRLDGVAPSDIRLEIHARGGVVKVPIAADGRIDMPLDDALRTENPTVVTNQPKGSLTLTVTIGLRVPNELRVPWRDLDAALTQTTEATKLIAPDTGRVTGVEIHFEPGADANVTIAGKSERLLVADEAGRIVLMRDDSLDREQPTIVFSRRPRELLPYVDAN